LESEKTRQREFGNLNKIPNNYSKFVLSMDKQIDFSQNGIKHFNIEEWLLN
jgi:predicted AAA+ superfamily ATPase